MRLRAGDEILAYQIRDKSLNICIYHSSGMSYKAEVYKVMIASPGDVNEERKIIREVLSEWNAINSETRKIVLLPVGWETHSSPGMGDRAQAIINEQLKDCDLLIGVFWTRIGTATGEYKSGSVEEIQRHIDAKKPVMLYFSSVPVALDTVDPVQYSELQKFKQLCEQNGLCGNYSNLIEFRLDFNRQLHHKLNSKPFTEQDQPEIQSNTVAEQSKATQKNYDRLIKEMDDLIGPLFSKMDDSTAPFFTVVSHSGEGAPFFQEIFSFWRDVKSKVYLAPMDLKVSLNNYLGARQKYRKVMKDRATPNEEIAAVRALFDQAIEDLKPKIKDRYNELSEQIAECERKRGISPDKEKNSGSSTKDQAELKAFLKEYKADKDRKNVITVDSVIGCWLGGNYIPPDPTASEIANSLLHRSSSFEDLLELTRLTNEELQKLLDHMISLGVIHKKTDGKYKITLSGEELIMQQLL